MFQACKVVPSEVTTVMWLLSMDELLASTHAHLRPAAMKYLAALDPYSHKLCIFAQEICGSMSSTCKFLKACRVKVSNGLLGLYIVVLTLFQMHHSFLAKMELQVVLSNIHCVKLLFLFFISRNLETLRKNSQTLFKNLY